MGKYFIKINVILVRIILNQNILLTAPEIVQQIGLSGWPQHDKSRKHYLAELEAKGAQLCKEHGKILHQVEHMQWHLEGCKHKPCHKSKENLSHHHHHHHHSHHGSEKKLNTSGGSSAATATNTTIGGGGSVISQTTPRPSQLSNLRNSSERIIKEIIELRKRSHILQERLEHEVKVRNLIVIVPV